MKKFFTAMIIAATLMGCGNDKAETPVVIAPTPETEVEEVVVRVAKPIMGKDMRSDNADPEPMTVVHVNYMEKHLVASVDYIGLDGDRENFRVFANVNDNGVLIGRKGECKRVMITDVIMDDLLSGGAYCSASVQCQDHMFDDCKDDREIEEKATTDTEKSDPPAGTDDVVSSDEVAKNDDAMTIAKSALIAAKSASDAAERARKIAEKSLSVATDNKGLLERIAEKFDMTLEGDDVETDKDEGNKPESES